MHRGFVSCQASEALTTLLSKQYKSFQTNCIAGSRKRNLEPIISVAVVALLNDLTLQRKKDQTQ